MLKIMPAYFSNAYKVAKFAVVCPEHFSNAVAFSTMVTWPYKKNLVFIVLSAGA